MRCKQCGCEFKPCKRGVRFCSHSCHDLSRQVVDALKIQRLAAAGETKAEIARQLGVSYITVRRAIQKYGYEHEWRAMRYA